MVYMVFSITARKNVKTSDKTLEHEVECFCKIARPTALSSRRVSSAVPT